MEIKYLIADPIDIPERWKISIECMKENVDINVAGAMENIKTQPIFCKEIVSQGNFVNVYLIFCLEILIYLFRGFAIDWCNRKCKNNYPSKQEC